MRRWSIRTLGLLSLAVTIAYLTWRIGWTLALDVWWVSIPLVVLEIHAAIGLALFTFSLWDVDRRPQARDVTTSDARIAVLILTYNEDVEVLMPTIAAAVAMRVQHATWVLDDGDRPEIAALAATLGARYIARPTHEHAKAGNVNHALPEVAADFVAILDADHVADADFFVRTLGGDGRTADPSGLPDPHHSFTGRTAQPVVHHLHDRCGARETRRRPPDDRRAS